MSRITNGQQPIGVIGGRCYGIVDPVELQRQQMHQESLRYQQESNSLHNIPKRKTRFEQLNEHVHYQHQQSTNLLTLMYPVSDGASHKQLYENDYSRSQNGYNAFRHQLEQQKMAMPSVPIQQLVDRRQDLLRQMAEAPNNYLLRLAFDDCESQINHWAAINQQQTTFPEYSQPQGKGINQKPEGMSRKQFNKMQPWVRKDSLRNGLTISGGVGKKLLSRMGWKEGRGIGRVGEGPVEPVVPEVFRAADRKGLSTEGEANKSSSAPVVASGKHPVSVLMEICAKNKFPPPEFTEVMSDGPSHRPHFIFKVCVNETDYQPTTSSLTKKDAKAMAAVVALQAMGVLSSTPASANPAMEISIKSSFASDFSAPSTSTG